MRRRRSATPWIVAGVVILLLLSGLSFGYVWLAGRGCDGAPTTITVLASPDQYDTMSGLAKEWQKTEPEVDGDCVGAVVERKDAAAVAAALGPSWDARRDGPRPDVWAPDSSAWLLVAADRPDAAGMIPPNPAHLASSPVVIAMPKPMAESLKWPQAQLGWRELITTFGGGKTWADAVRDANWGRFKIGMTDPATSTAGLHALFGITDFNADDQVSDEEVKAGLIFERTVTSYLPDTGKLLEGLAKADATSQAAALAYVSAFPALEREVLAYNAADPKVPLAPFYAKEGTADADYPYAVLAAAWVDDQRQQIAEQFLTFLRSDTGRKAYGAAGFRAPDRSVELAPGLTAERGFQPTIEAPARELTSAASVTRTVVAWTALRRRSNILAVLDTSGSMADPAPGTPLTKLQVVQGAASRAAILFSNATRLGLWQFSSKQTPTSDHRELVPITQIGGQFRGVPTRAVLLQALQSLKAKGGTGLYDTTVAAYAEAQRNWEPGKINLVVIMTDGRNEDDVGLNREQMLSQLKRSVKPDRPVQIVTIAYGADADVNVLREISGVTGGRTFVSRTAADIEKVFLAALFGSR